jgi:phytoene dehydrogenase-like protein
LAGRCLTAGHRRLPMRLPPICRSLAERQAAAGRSPERPFVLTAQPNLWDRTRAPEGKHALWAYCHVPYGATVDMTGPIEQQIERCAPGFRKYPDFASWGQKSSEVFWITC